METKKGECKSVQYVETVKANSFSGRYGGVGTDFKIYFDTIEDLKKGLDAILEGKRLMELSTVSINTPMGVK
jgi:hypothetical protein|tara:strand:+ start:7050 stop:7265 length:216 start_codon:yes stop_codon:yes gene_type:complete